MVYIIEFILGITSLSFALNLVSFMGTDVSVFSCCIVVSSFPFATKKMRMDYFTVKSWNNSGWKGPREVT